MSYLDEMPMDTTNVMRYEERLRRLAMKVPPSLYEMIERATDALFFDFKDSAADRILTRWGV